MKLGDFVVIYGAGPIGLIAAQWAKAAGAGCVKIVDISPEKIEFAKKYGFDLYDPEKDGAIDCAIEGTGASAALNNAIKALKAHGRLVLMGNPIKEMTIEKSTYSQILRKEITMIGTWNSSYNQMINDWEATIKAMADGVVEYESMITHKYPLSECNKALEMMRDRKEFYTKVTIVAE